MMNAGAVLKTLRIEEAEPPEPAASPALQRLRAALPEAFRSHIRSARDLAREVREEEDEPIPTALPALDRLLEGGLPKGQLVELIGARSSGRFSTLLSVLAARTGVGEAAALVDLGDGLDPETAAAMGVDLERLLWVRPEKLKDALAAAEMLLGAGFPLVVLDLGPPPVRGGRGVEAAWLRLARAARAHGAALLVGSPYRVTGTAPAVVLKAGKARPAWLGGEGSPRLLAGVSSRLTLEKCRGRLPGQGEDVPLVWKDAPLPAAPPPRPARPKRREEEAPAAPLVFRRAAAG
ncbi:MAG TPA: hypothetical protein VLQ45_14605 [Thermoanaerobaculia bacterium]|nr:hypothetical protein [Thermoanaerobaculia bacterium]